MKKLLFLILVLGMFAACSKEDIIILPSESFPDKMFLDYLLSNYDIDKDGAISIEEAKAVKEIHISEISGMLKSLKGIEHFTSLEKLIIRGHTGTEAPDLSKKYCSDRIYLGHIL